MSVCCISVLASLIQSILQSTLIHMRRIHLMILISCHQCLNPLTRIQQITDRSIMIQSINQISNILAHITVNIIRSFQQFRSLVYQIRCQNLINNSGLISQIKFLQAIRKEPKRRSNKDTSSISLLQLSCNIQHTFTGRNHIVYNNNRFSFNRSSQKFM